MAALVVNTLNQVTYGGVLFRFQGWKWVRRSSFSWFSFKLYVIVIQRNEHRNRFNGPFSKDIQRMRNSHFHLFIYPWMTSWKYHTLHGKWWKWKYSSRSIINLEEKNFILRETPCFHQFSSNILLIHDKLFEIGFLVSARLSLTSVKIASLLNTLTQNAMEN